MHGEINPFLDFLFSSPEPGFMRNITCTRRIQFCSGHRVLNHESKCANLHGHNYVAYFYATAPSLDDLGRVIDFSVLKEKIGGWIDNHWDHTTILYNEDSELIDVCDSFVKNKKVFIAYFNPTAENMADYLLREVCPKVLRETGVVVTKVVLWETENCFAEAVL